jgi:capsular polysaccharide biosynthesis protein
VVELLFRWVARRIAIPVLQKARNETVRHFIRFFRALFASSGLPIGAHGSTREWAEHSGNSSGYQEIRGPETIHRALPKTIDAKVHSIFRQSLVGQSPAVFVATISGARVVGTAGHVIAPDNKVLGDVSREWFFNADQHSLLFKFKLPPTQNLPGLTVPLAVISGGTYYHWMTDVLPRLAIIEKGGCKLEAVDHFIVNDSRAPFLRESLDLLGIPQEKCVFTSKQMHLLCEKVVLPSVPGVPGKTPKWVVDFLRERFLPKVPQAGKRRRIYVSRQRSKYRKLRNGEEVREILLSRGFEEFFLEELPFRKQIELFASAEAVVSVHGAGLTNLAFCPSRTKVLEIFSPNYVNECFWNIVTWLDLEYAYLLGNGKRPEEFEDPHRVEEDVEASIAGLNESLDLLKL